MSMRCNFEKKNGMPPCLSLYSKKRWYLRDFLINAEKKWEYISIIPKLNCLTITEWRIKIDQSKCIKCLFCVANCPKSLITISDDFTLSEKCSNFNKNIDINEDIVKSLFNWELIEIPYSRTLWNTSKYKSLSDFTKVSETQNIAIWWASLIKFLSNDPNCRLWLEIKIIIENRDRGGRLDVCLFSEEKHFFTFETKVWFKKMMQENRYISQMISYRHEIDRNLIELNLNDVDSYQILLIWDNETDLLFEDHPKCTSRVWKQAQQFYMNLVKYGLFFLSANALWSLTLYRIHFNKEIYSLENIFRKIITKNTYWLVSAWVITYENNQFIIKPLENFIYQD